MNLKTSIHTILIFVFLFNIHFSPSQEKLGAKFLEKTEKEIVELMDKGNIPGLSVVLIKDNEQLIKNYGFANLKHRKPVTSNTLFELGSCSKAFTALAVASLEQQGRIDLEKNVSDYIPWFYTVYKDSLVKITLNQLLHHTSGIPWHTISKIPASREDDALEQTVKQLIGQELDEPPGKKHDYATINYDVLALIIEIVTKQPFEVYLKENVIDRLDLSNTSIGEPKDRTKMSTGYKIGFFRPREYQAPIYKGNNAAGYVISNAKDIALWMKFQMGLVQNEKYGLAKLTHQRDKTVPLHQMSSYAMGWEVSLNGTGEIYHGGTNPNFTSYITFRPKEGIGVAVLSNSNSNYTRSLGNKLMKWLADEKIEKEYDPGDGGDKMYASISLGIVLYILVVMVFMGIMGIHIVKGKRRFSISWNKVGLSVRSVVMLLPFLYGFYILPEAIYGFTWEAILVWTPISFPILIGAVLISIAISYLAYFIGLCFPEENEYKRRAPTILLVSILSGLANVLVIIMVTSAIDTEVEVKYLVFYYTLTIALYLLGRRFVQISLIRFARNLVYDLRIQLIDRIFSTSYERFEKIDRGRIYTTLNDDVNAIGQSTNLLVTLITSTITALGAFLYLSSIAFWATLLTIFLVVTLSTLYYVVSERTNRYYEEARDSRNVFMRLINGMIDGFKEISLHRNKKMEYKDDVAMSANEFKNKISIADIKFTNAYLVGESLLVVLLGLVAIGMSEIFPNIRLYTIMSFVIVLLYLIGPINGILGAVPFLMQLKIAWYRVQQFIKEIPANLDINEIPRPKFAYVERIEARGIQYQFKDEDGNKNGFSIGPVNLEVNSGEVLFIIGGNGSGKTTLAKLLTGLYKPDKGKITVNNNELNNFQLSEYFSTVFSFPYLFEKLYSVNVEDKKGDIMRYLKLLHLEEKIEITKNGYSTINLSGGQKKRLALLQCYLEDSPIYLFDEWAADQDPEYRNFFYRALIPEMKKMGKIVIAITHDDHYFDVADKVLKMNQGKLEIYSDKNLWAPAESVDEDI